MVGDMMGSFGQKASSMLGLGDLGGAVAQTQQTAAITTAMTTMTTEMTTGMATVSAEATSGFALLTTEATTAYATMTAETTAAMLTMTAEVTTAMATMAASSGGGFLFADGGIMSSAGSMPLHAYAAGGIANKPQLALFGEGRMPEAYVPLPDGRTIPVTMTGDGGAGNNVVISITVNKNGDDKQESQGDDAQAWNRVAQRVRGVVMEELVTQQRPGGVLYK
jgi:hypothetical protein